MPTVVILATTETALADVWERQLPPGRVALRLGTQGLPAGAGPGFAAVVVLDAASDAALPPALVRCPTVFVGEPKSLPFEQARMAGRAKIFLSYEESAVKLRELLPLLEELAEKQSLVDMLAEKNRRLESTPRSQQRSVPDATELWDFLEAAIECIDARDRLIAEFRRASRHMLRASHAVFFLRESDGFRADRGTSYFAADDPLVGFFEVHPAVIDGTKWDIPADPIAELAVRNRLALWGARMLVPIHDNGRLLGLIALGVRDDGQSYDEADRIRAIFFARLLRHFLAKSAQVSRLNVIAEQTSLGAKYLPGTLVLGQNEGAPRHIPLVVRDAIGQARRTREICRVPPSVGQPFRASAGIISETGGVWAFWEEASGEVHDAINREKAGRREVLRELALTLSHELGNALVSLTTFRQAGVERPLPAALIKTIKNDVAQLEILNDHFALMHGIHDADSAPVDIREIAGEIGASMGVRAELGNEPVVLTGSRKLLDFAVRALVKTLCENRQGQTSGEMVMRLRSTGFGPEMTALLSLRGKHLELEGILPEPVEGGVPNQGRLGVFLAKEILRLHNGEIHAGPGMEGTEILISFRKL